MPTALSKIRFIEFAHSYGIVVNSQTKQRFTYNDPCVERGATVAYDEQAHKSSLQAVEEILRDNLKLN
jgi:hypothetical protein